MVARFASATPSPLMSSALVDAGRRRVDRRSLAVEGLALEVVGRLGRPDDLQAHDRGELPVALVAAGHAHDRAGAVVGQHVVGRPHRDLLPVTGLVAVTPRSTPVFGRSVDSRSISVSLRISSR